MDPLINRVYSVVTSAKNINLRRPSFGSGICFLNGASQHPFRIKGSAIHTVLNNGNEAACKALYIKECKLVK